MEYETSCKDVEYSNIIKQKYDIEVEDFSDEQVRKRNFEK